MNHKKLKKMKMGVDIENSICYTSPSRQQVVRNVYLIE